MPSPPHLVHGPGTALHPAELTLAHTVPAMAELIPLAEQSRAEAERAIDGLWALLHCANPGRAEAATSARIRSPRPAHRSRRPPAGSPAWRRSTGGGGRG